MLPKELERISSIAQMLTLNAEHKKYESLSSIPFYFNEVFPIAGAFVLGISKMQLVVPDAKDDNDEFQIAFTFFPEPEKQRTTLVLGGFPAGHEINLFYSRINILDNSELKGLFSKLIIENGSNSYFAPRFISKLSAEEKTYLLNRGTTNVAKDQQNSIGQFNLFESRFADVLG